VVITRPGLAPRWHDAWRKRDDLAMGDLLGFPACCQEFFQRVWVDAARVDTTWCMTGTPLENPARLFSTPAEANILLRWIGVRPVFHLPCSFFCAETIMLARRIRAVADARHLSLDVAYDMLNWPVEWSALHGIAEIRTPVCTIATRTDYTPAKRVVQRAGSAYPDEGSQGLRFPYRIVKDKATAVPSFQRSLTPVWELNGFSSEQAMQQAHNVLVQAAVLRMKAAGARVLDLGCGSGVLLERFQRQYECDVHGVENDNVRAGAAQVPVTRVDLMDPEKWPSGEWDVVILMPGRLLEAPERADAVRQALRARAHAVLFYAYGDWLKQDQLPGLLRRAGLAQDWTYTMMLGDASHVQATLALPTQVGAITH
jgi:2-polyprenyl-3-methyl-5-hydroxy-6-metoxy-1,4-benzoquinol methylase